MSSLIRISSSSIPPQLISLFLPCLLYGTCSGMVYLEPSTSLNNIHILLLPPIAPLQNPDNSLHFNLYRSPLIHPSLGWGFYFGGLQAWIYFLLVFHSYFLLIHSFYSASSLPNNRTIVSLLLQVSCPWLPCGETRAFPNYEETW